MGTDDREPQQTPCREPLSSLCIKLFGQNLKCDRDPRNTDAKNLEHLLKQALGTKQHGLKNNA